MKRRNLWKRVAALAMAAVITVPAGVMTQLRVEAAEAVIANGNFEKEGAIDAAGWKIGAAIAKAEVNTTTLINHTFDTDIMGWTCNKALSVADNDALNSKVLNVAKGSSRQVRNANSPMLDASKNATLNISLKVSTNRATITLKQYKEDGTTELADAATNITNSEVVVDGWYKYTGSVTVAADCAKIVLNLKTLGAFTATYNIDDVVIESVTSTGKVTYSDGVLLSGTDGELKLSNGNSTTYDAATLEEAWYDYSYDVRTENAAAEFKAGLTVGGKMYTETTGKFKATAGANVGFATEGTGVAYFDDLTINKHEHKFASNLQDNTTLASAATCTKKATYYKHCDECGENSTDTYEVGEALGHDRVHHDKVEAECAKDGNIEYWQCSRCQTLFNADNDEAVVTDVTVKKHNKEKKVKNDATCTEDGNIEYWACECGKMYSDETCTTELKDVTVKKHTQEYVDRKEATCTEDGNVAHYKCSCGVFYEDAECTKQLESVILPKHTQTPTVRKEATCTEDGNIAYWTCTCGKIYSDEACTKEVKAEDLGLAKHTQTHVDYKAATCEEAGNIEYWACECGKYYSDEACTTEVAKDALVIKALGHKPTLVAKKNATCTANGYEAYYVCDTCKNKYSDEACTDKIDAPKTIAKHTAKPVKAVASTYTKTGMKAHYKCSCGKLYTDKACTKVTTKAKLTVAVKKLTVAKTSVKKVTAKSKALAVKWTKKSGVTGYEVQVALKKNFKSGLKKATVKGASKTTVTVKKLKAKKTYYVRVRAYKKVEGKTFYSAWSSVKTKKTK